MTLPRLRNMLPWMMLALPLAALVAEQRSLAGYISGDFRIFHRAVGRFLADPAMLYGAPPGQVPEAAITLQGFIYPPPGILFLLPFGLGSVPLGFALFTVAVLASVSAGCVLWLGWMDRLTAAAHQGAPMEGQARLFLLLMALASGPVVACRGGQVDGFVMLACVVGAVLARGRWAALGGAVLAVAAWFKIYPVLVLVPLLARREGRGALLAGFMAGAVAVPLVSALVLPPAVWRSYFLDLLPAMSARTIVNVYNQSFGAFVARSDVPSSMALDGYDTVLLPIRLKAGVLAMGACALGLAWIKARRGGEHTATGVAIAMATISLIAPLGWGHTYIYTLPLQMLLAREAMRQRSALVSGFLLAVWGAMVISANHRFGFADGAPVLWNALYGRYALATLVLVLVASVPGAVAPGRRFYASAR